MKIPLPVSRFAAPHAPAYNRAFTRRSAAVLKTALLCRRILRHSRIILITQGMKLLMSANGTSLPTRCRGSACIVKKPPFRKNDRAAIATGGALLMCWNLRPTATTVMFLTGTATKSILRATVQIALRILRSSISTKRRRKNRFFFFFRTLSPTTKMTTVGLKVRKNLCRNFRMRRFPKIYLFFAGITKKCTPITLPAFAAWTTT